MIYVHAYNVHQGLLLSVLQLLVKLMYVINHSVPLSTFLSTETNVVLILIFIISQRFVFLFYLFCH